MICIEVSRYKIQKNFNIQISKIQKFGNWNLNTV